MNPIISVVICTHNRAEYLRKSLRSVVQQSFPKDKYEILVIDNASTDTTKEIIELESEKSNKIKYIYEPILGLSQARNTGWLYSNGDYVAYLDDDAIPDKYWLVNIYEFIKDYPNANVVGGAVQPIWPYKPPSWLNKEISKYLSVIQYEGDKHGFILDFPNQYIGGGNTTYSRSILKEMNGFKPHLGRKGNILLSGEETELNYRIQKDNYPIWFCPKAIIYHHIPPKRCSKEYFRSISYWSGRTKALVDFEVNQKNYKIIIIRRILSRFSKNLCGSIIKSILVRKNLFEFEINLLENIGYLCQGTLILVKGSKLNTLY